ncbi:MAG: hypothetical protein K0Q92_3800 [Steroidobacteraceae bacterium]|jgi:hypothetical protein|nr:hypothetical protein [Steroidobacteraceae bacterium]
MHTFDIRFAKSEGLAALFEAPANRRGWKGAGKLSIDSQGISIAMKRGLPGLFSRRLRRFAAHDLAEVYREGDALRLEFATNFSREVLPIWTRGAEVAAEIVQLLPTRQTVELEHSTSPASAYRLDRVLCALMVAVVVMIAGAVYLLNRSPATIQAPATATPAPAAAEPDAPTADAVEKAAPALPMARTSPAWPAARRHVTAFEAEIATLRAEFVTLMESPSPLRLDGLAAKWHEKLQGVQITFGSQTGELLELANIQAAICINWREFLYNYAGGLREQDLERINAAFAAREQADLLRERMRWYVPD